eukprot:381574_1
MIWKCTLFVVALGTMSIILGLLFMNFNDISNILMEKKFFSIHEHKSTGISMKFNFFCNATIFSIYWGAHHKTGHVLTRQISKKISFYWKQKCHPNHSIKTISNFTGTITPDQMFRGSLTPFYNEYPNRYKLLQWINRKTTNRFYAIFDIIRDPVDTVLSGYNYHKTTNTIGDKWVKKPITNISTLTLWGLDATYLNLSLQQIYKTYNLSIGIAAEYQQYKNVFSDINESYNIIDKVFKQQYKNNQLTHFKVFRLETFQYDWDKNINELFDIIGIVNMKHREHLRNEINLLNIYHNKTKAMQNKHVTKGKYDKQKQLDILLLNNERCRILRQLTRDLDYKWKYSMHC